MRVSAGLILSALLLFGIQFGFSDGTEPNILPLPIGMVPLTLGATALLAGLVIGLVFGNGLYRAAIGLALLGTAFAIVAFQLMVIGGAGRRPLLTVNEIALIAAALTWLLALVVGARALRRRERAA
jgi:hypothetical protein